MGRASDSIRSSRAGARTRQLAERSKTDLKLLHDAALADGIPYSQLMRIQRAESEVKGLLRDLENNPNACATLKTVERQSMP
jgi:hypothetical protein